jgi:hypothetical protein
MNQIIETIEKEVNSRPSPIEFEMAYQARVAIDRIRFAIKHTEQFYPQSEHVREARFQLLDALGRLESADRNFQRRFRASSRTADSQALSNVANGPKPTERNGE